MILIQLFSLLQILVKFTVLEYFQKLQHLFKGPSGEGRCYKGESSTSCSMS